MRYFKFLLVLIVLMVSNSFISAGNIESDWGNHATGNTVTWDQNKGRYVFVIRYYDFSGTDENIQYANVSIAGKTVFSIKGEHCKDDNVNPPVKIKCTRSDGQLWAITTDGRQRVSYVNSKEYSSSTSLTAANGWNTYKFPSDASDKMMGTCDAPVLLYLDGRTGLHNAASDAATEAEKIIYGNQLYILRNGVTYTAEGTIVPTPLR